MNDHLIAFLQFYERMEKVVDIPGINFVEQRHQDEDIKDHGEVDIACSRLGTLIFVTLYNRNVKTYE